MKQLLSIFLLFVSSSLFGNASLFNYDLWAKDLKIMIELSQGLESSIRGHDKNKNLVRDDVENYIKDKYNKDEFQKIIFLEAAKKIQEIITLPENTSIDIHKKLDEQLLQIYTCRDFILFKHGDVDVEKEMLNKSEFKAKVLNTASRLNAYIKHKKLIPFKYTIPNDKELLRQKNACEKLYSRIKSESKSSSIISAK